ncbi:hypothetical protein GGF31_005152 [Allomyces arbusculus]|nr:hypothetical protein GGF31_005152 [Allomyces arbusculus]
MPADQATATPEDQAVAAPCADAPPSLHVFGNSNLSVEEFLDLLSDNDFGSATPPEHDFQFDLASSPGSPGNLVGTVTASQAVPMVEDQAAAAPAAEEPPVAMLVPEGPAAASSATAVQPTVEGPVKLKGAAAKIVEERKNRFMSAVRKDQVSVVTAMLAEYTDGDEFAPWHVKSDFQDAYGTVLHVAVKERNFRTIEALCSDSRVCRDLLHALDDDNLTPLERCVAREDWYLNATMKALLDAGANVATVSTLANAFTVMRQNEDEELLTRLVKQFPSEIIKEPVGFGGLSASAAAVNAAKEVGNTIPLRVLVNLKLLDLHGQMVLPLHVAAECGSAELVQFLLENGAQKDHVRNEDGQVPLHVAAIHGHVEIMDLLVHIGANLQQRNHNGWTPLACAVAHNCGHVIEYLRGSDVSFVDRACRFRAANNQSLVDLATEYGHHDLSVELMLMGVSGASTAVIRQTPEVYLASLNAAGARLRELAADLAAARAANRRANQTIAALAPPSPSDPDASETLSDTSSNLALPPSNQYDFQARAKHDTYFRRGRAGRQSRAKAKAPRDRTDTHGDGALEPARKRQRTEGDAPSMLAASAEEPTLSSALMTDKHVSADADAHMNDNDSHSGDAPIHDDSRRGGLPGGAQDLTSAVMSQDPTNGMHGAVPGGLHGAQQVVPPSQTGSQRHAGQTSQHLAIAGGDHGQESGFDIPARPRRVRRRRRRRPQPNLNNCSLLDDESGDGEGD